MNISEIIIGDRVLLQINSATKEIATIKGINKNNGMVIAKLSNDEFSNIHPQFILKSFGQL